MIQTVYNLSSAPAIDCLMGGNLTNAEEWALLTDRVKVSGHNVNRHVYEVVARIVDPVNANGHWNRTEECLIGGMVSVHTAELEVTASVNSVRAAAREIAADSGIVKITNRIRKNSLSQMTALKAYTAEYLKSQDVYLEEAKTRYLDSGKIYRVMLQFDWYGPSDMQNLTFMEDMRFSHEPNTELSDTHTAGKAATAPDHGETSSIPAVNSQRQEYEAKMGDITRTLANGGSDLFGFELRYRYSGTDGQALNAIGQTISYALHEMPDCVTFDENGMTTDGRSDRISASTNGVITRVNQDKHGLKCDLDVNPNICFTSYKKKGGADSPLTLRNPDKAVGYNLGMEADDVYMLNIDDSNTYRFGKCNGAAKGGRHLPVLGTQNLGSIYTPYKADASVTDRTPFGRRSLLLEGPGALDGDDYDDGFDDEDEDFNEDVDEDVDDEDFLFVSAEDEEEVDLKRERRRQARRQARRQRPLQQGQRQRGQQQQGQQEGQQQQGQQEGQQRAQQEGQQPGPRMLHGREVIEVKFNKSWPLWYTPTAGRTYHRRSDTRIPFAMHNMSVTNTVQRLQVSMKELSDAFRVFYGTGSGGTWTGRLHQTEGWERVKEKEPHAEALYAISHGDERDRAAGGCAELLYTATGFDRKDFSSLETAGWTACATERMTHSVARHRGVFDESASTFSTRGLLQWSLNNSHRLTQSISERALQSFQKKRARHLERGGKLTKKLDNYTAEALVHERRQLLRGHAMRYAPASDTHGSMHDIEDFAGDVEDDPVVRRKRAEPSVQKMSHMLDFSGALSYKHSLESVEMSRVMNEWTHDYATGVLSNSLKDMQTFLRDATPLVSHISNVTSIEMNYLSERYPSATAYMKRTTESVLRPSSFDPAAHPFTPGKSLADLVESFSTGLDSIATASAPSPPGGGRAADSDGLFGGTLSEPDAQLNLGVETVRSLASGLVSMLDARSYVFDALNIRIESPDGKFDWTDPVPRREWRHNSSQHSPWGRVARGLFSRAAPDHFPYEDHDTDTRGWADYLWPPGSGALFTKNLSEIGFAHVAMIARHRPHSRIGVSTDPTLLLERAAPVAGMASGDEFVDAMHPRMRRLREASLRRELASREIEHRRRRGQDIDEALHEAVSGAAGAGLLSTVAPHATMDNRIQDFMSRDCNMGDASTEHADNCAFGDMFGTENSKCVSPPPPPLVENARTAPPPDRE